MSSTLFYIHDPMCSWCWAFKPALSQLLYSLPADIKLQRLVGGLAPDSDEPMPATMQQMLQHTWKHIQNVVPGTKFNYDFWKYNQPRRSTWPSCRAVLSASRQNPDWEEPMISAIQKAYYLEAKNPSDTEILVSLAESIGCDAQAFSQYLHSEQAQVELAQQRSMAQQLGATGFPSLVFRNSREHYFSIPADYHRADAMFEQIEYAQAN